MERIIPISNIWSINAVPPDEKNGRDIPVFGMEFVTTAIFNSACRANFREIPNTTRAEKRSGAR